MKYLSPRELDTILAALRLWQDRNMPDGLHPRRLLDLEQVIATEHGPSLDCEEIDALCERLNAEAGGLAEDAAGVADDKPWFRNFYKCSECGTKWQDEHDCTCNDRCPKCNAEIEPHHSEDAS